MNQAQQTPPFQNDQRLSHLDKERLATLQTFASELASAPQNQKMSTFLSINKRASDMHVMFSKEERDLLIEVLTENMTAEEKHRVSIIQNLSAKLFSAKA